ncbi:Rod shape-determining protein MreD [Deinococcus cavernae]|uniref:Rod shape-determining protein MreD n=2 Tax=Deinococcus cavernae TaxID=2320857 RepID=A0A418VCL3_9DEIO|nr:Rod shape-determining protein MreD [Deinococcus cavernae]
MIVAYFVLLIIVQGFLARLLQPIGIAPPDLFLLTGAALAWRWRPTGALLGAFTVGLLQDILGAGALGLHAVGLAGGALLVLAVRRWLPGGGWRRLALTVAAALVGQWFTFTLLTYMLRTNLVTVPTLLKVVPMTFLTTFLIGWWWESLMTYLLGRPQEGLD